ncbi:uncharacterized protein LOC112054242 [Bicyclus anynana]|uniref:Uncharacterized protein LOC112054242 n=1 Tax=Bicyclus anynana TaxID=110368 RepID=A0ABM3M1J8_BICAN|nr:uncharacterized protein LOC112054242 [Bicyclus anynana]
MSLYMFVVLFMVLLAQDGGADVTGALWENYSLRQERSSQQAGPLTDLKSSCQIECKNNGTCVDNTCLCPFSFYGKYCEKTPCLDGQPLPNNSNRRCTAHQILTPPSGDYNPARTKRSILVREPTIRCPDSLIWNPIAKLCVPVEKNM